MHYMLQSANNTRKMATRTLEQEVSLKHFPSQVHTLTHSGSTFEAGKSPL
jgi:hypothetical protein